MGEKSSKTGGARGRSGGPNPAPTRAERQAAALRQNLKRRKQQRRLREAEPGAAGDGRGGTDTASS